MTLKTFSVETDSPCHGIVHEPHIPCQQVILPAGKACRRKNIEDFSKK
jgi:hypothetical protein